MRTGKVCFYFALALAAGLFALCLAQGARAASYQRGSSGPVVRQIQTRLRDWGYYSVAVDGVSVDVSAGGSWEGDIVVTPAAASGEAS